MILCNLGAISSDSDDFERFHLFLFAFSGDFA